VIAVIAVVIAAAEKAVVKEPRRAVIATKRGNPDTLRKEVAYRCLLTVGDIEICQMTTRHCLWK
jgi:hypothetical protein